MISRITRSLAKRRSALQEGDAGFTLIELLVVVLIIGILAAIAIPIFVSQQNGAKDSAAKSDLGTAKTAMISYATTNSAYPAAATITSGANALSPFGFTPSSGVTTTIVSDNYTSGAFCLKAVSAAGNSFYVTDQLGVSTTACS